MNPHSITDLGSNGYWLAEDAAVTLLKLAELMNNYGGNCTGAEVTGTYPLDDFGDVTITLELAGATDAQGDGFTVRTYLKDRSGVPLNEPDFLSNLGERITQALHGQNDFCLDPSRTTVQVMDNGVNVNVYPEAED